MTQAETKTEVEVPESLARAAAEHGWPLDIVKEGLALGVNAGFIERSIRSGIGPEAAHERFTNYRLLGGIPALDMSWAKVPTDRLPRLKPGTKGLRLADVEVGAYGFVPDRWPIETDLPRGAYPPPQTGILASYTIYDKAEVWAESCRELYEDAIAERWTSANDISWSTMEPLPDHIEQSICQLMTHWAEDALIGCEVIAGWLERISYGFHEVKLYLGTQVFDYARHAETFRKRALANGGGLGYQAPGAMHRAIFSAMKFTEMITYITVRSSFFLSLLERAGLSLARNEAERKMYAYVAQDVRRHIRYGLDHLKWYLQTQHQKRSTVMTWLLRGELQLASDIRNGTPQNEALILLLDDSPAAGKRKLDELRRKQVEDYCERLREATITRTPEEIAPGLRRVLGLDMPARA
ncbi:MAG TPA: hypothetical protein VNN10_04795 [Dehalococcoidia bacterium]|nr:hypothetical protein [Dehalococcoidia bacterium]